MNELCYSRSWHIFVVLIYSTGSQLTVSVEVICLIYCKNNKY
jgi:hypothetical protein